jgi:hypothetical protein
MIVEAEYPGDGTGYLISLVREETVPLRMDQRPLEIFCFAIPITPTARDFFLELLSLDYYQFEDVVLCTFEELAQCLDAFQELVTSTFAELDDTNEPRTEDLVTTDL